MGASRLPSRLTSSDLLILVGAQLVAALLALAALRALTFHPDLLPVLVVAAPITVLSVAAPRWVVPALLGLTWTLAGDRVLDDFPSPIDVGAVLLLAYAAWHALRRVEIPRVVPLATALLTVPIVATGLSSVEGAELAFGDIAEIALLPIAALLLPMPRDVSRTLAALSGIAVFLGLGAVYSVTVEPTTLFPVTAPGSERAAGPVGDPVLFALSLATLMPLVAHVALHEGQARLVGVVALPCLVAGLVASGSTSALLLGVAAVAALALTHGRRARYASTVAAVLALFPLTAAQAVDGPKDLVTKGKTDDRAALEMFFDHPLVGVGPDRYPALYADYAGDERDRSRERPRTRSLPLQIVAEQGLVGLVGWVGALLVVARFLLMRGIWRMALGRTLLVATAAYLAGSLFLHGEDLRLLYLLIGMMLALGTATPRPLVSARR